ncbi:hypothetical protein [Psychrobacter sp. ANT_WB68]|uniref:hypothetical protein n=1 Tax=Psychrobacter sp. ANT_WB68 TaxID=2597355 RepID=UPI0011F387E0|nr:hypothetical protein [Psychrobacter sp. ANT_WB68]KAA0915800.1 hypothetical protein FQ084_04505 [Psychrobacter sp. ANT_WB68]
MMIRVDSTFLPDAGNPISGFFTSKFWQGIAMCELTNQQAYDYYQEATMPSGKDYWLNFLRDRANRGVVGAQGFVDKIEFCEKK